MIDLLTTLIFIPMIVNNSEYVNEWEHQIYVDVGAAEENAWIAEAWDYMDPYPTITQLNPVFEFSTPDGWLVEYVNFYTIEDEAYHWWTGVGDAEVCFEQFCVTEWPQGFRLTSTLDIDVFIIKVTRVPGITNP